VPGWVQEKRRVSPACRPCVGRGVRRWTGL